MVTGNHHNRGRAISKCVRNGGCEPVIVHASLYKTTSNLLLSLCIPATSGVRSLSTFRIPTRSEEFYSDIFGSDDDRMRSRDIPLDQYACFV
jgi:hypothetical protein